MGEDAAGEDGVPDGGQTRVTLREASVLLGVSEGAIRKRVARGTIRSEMGDDDLRYVWVDEGTDAAASPGGAGDPLHRQMQARIDDLREQLQAERRANEENRRIIAALTSRIPQLEAPQETPESRDTIEEEPERAAPRPDAPGPQTGAQEPERRPWWRRLIGG